MSRYYHLCRILFVKIAIRRRQLLSGLVRRLMRRPVPISTLSQHNKLIEMAAKNLGIAVKRIDKKYLSLSNSDKKYFSTSSNFSFESLTAYWMCGDKLLSASMLAESGLPVPSFSGWSSANAATAFKKFADLPKPLVVKPARGSSGKGVTVDINNLRDFKRAFYNASAHCQDVIVEQFIEGRHWRVTLLRDELIVAWERLPAQVVGDGCSTIRELVNSYNGSLTDYKGFPIGKPIRIDKRAARDLSVQGLSADTVLDCEKVAYVHLVCNDGLGGRTRDVTDQLHQDFLELSIRAARTLNAQLAGVDIIAENITMAYVPGEAYINEVNTTPGLISPNYDIGGRLAAIDYAERLLRKLF